MMPEFDLCPKCHSVLVEVSKLLQKCPSCKREWVMLEVKR
jgi:Zn-finger nucleic acid-binding protein